MSHWDQMPKPRPVGKPENGTARPPVLDPALIVEIGHPAARELMTQNDWEIMLRRFFHHEVLNNTVMAGRHEG